MGMINNNLPDEIKARMDITVRSSFDDDLNETVPVAVLVVGVPATEMQQKRPSLDFKYSSEVVALTDDHNTVAAVLAEGITQISTDLAMVSRSDLDQLTTAYEHYQILYPILSRLVQQSPTHQLVFLREQLEGETIPLKTSFDQAAGRVFVEIEEPQAPNNIPQFGEN